MTGSTPLVKRPTCSVSPIRVSTPRSWTSSNTTSFERLPSFRRFRCWSGGICSAACGGLDPELSLDAAGLDLSQRARLAGGRVIVVPSSEVFHPLDCPDHQPGWRQQAGRQRAMLIAY